MANSTDATTRTPEENAALNVVARQADVDGTNPFANTYAAQDVHATRLGAATGALDAGVTPGGEAFQMPTAAAPTAKI